MRLLTFPIAALAAFVLAPAALANSANLEVLDAAGKPDPVAGVGRTFRLSGSSEVKTYVWVKQRPAGGAPCAPSYSTDSGDTFEWSGEAVNGSFEFNRARTWRTPGTYLFCVWFANSYDTSTTPISQQVTFRGPTGTVSAATSPASGIAGQPMTISITGASEAPKSVFAKIRAAGGAPCGPTSASDSGNSFLDGYDVNGTFSVTEDFTPTTAGTYLLCLWLADSYDDATPVAGPQSLTFTVAAPCVVPTVGYRMKLARARKQLARYGCTPGTITYKRSRTRSKGRVIRFKPRSGTRLAPGAAVGVVISKGRRH